MRQKFFPLLIAFSALAVSGSAAFYSVFGLSKLFAGASTQVIIMAGSLEFAKLVCASLLYQYWGTINKALRAYLSIAVFVLILITSGGIYGFLSGAYQETATKSEFLDKSLAVLQMKQTRFEEQKTDLSLEKTQLSTTISDLRTSLSNPAQVQYIDRESGQLITTTSSSARRALQSELNATITDRDKINLKLEAVQDSIMKLDSDLLELEMGNEEQRELGPLKYLSEVTGQPMNKVVNWFLLLIIFVFDPLAISLVIAANFAFAQIRTKPEDIEVTMSAPEGMEFNKPYPMPKSWLEPEDEEYDASEGLQEMLEKEKAKEKNSQDMPEEVLEEEILLDLQDNINEGKALAKGLDTFIEVLEEEEKEKEKDNIESKQPNPDQSPEHELYHGNDGKGKAYSDNDKRARRKRVIKRPKKQPPKRGGKGYAYKG